MILDHSFAVQLNFRNFHIFRNFRNQCFALFRQVSQIMFRKFSKYLFRKVLQIEVSRFYVCFARFRKVFDSNSFFYCRIQFST